MANSNVNVSNLEWDYKVAAVDVNEVHGSVGIEVSAFAATSYISCIYSQTMNTRVNRGGNV